MGYGGIAMTIFDLRRYLLDREVGDVNVLNIGEGLSLRKADIL